MLMEPSLGFIPIQHGQELFLAMGFGHDFTNAE